MGMAPGAPAASVLRDDLAHVELSNPVFAGTSVVAGTGTAVVITTGMNIAFGTIAHVTQSLADEPSPLQKELGHMPGVVGVQKLSGEFLRCPT